MTTIAVVYFYPKLFTVMKISTLLKYWPAALVLLCFTINTGHAQVYSYFDDSVGNYNAVAANATGTALGRINGATSPLPSCRYGFSSKNFTSAAVFSATLPADTLSVSPNAGYQLNITGFSVGLRRSNTGPDSARLAYSTNGGTTWTDQGYSFSPKNAGCDSTITAVWTKTVTVTYPGRLEFAVFGYNAGSTAGTFQIDTLAINGTVHTSTGFVEMESANEIGLTVSPNPVLREASISFTLLRDETVNIGVYDMLGQQALCLEKGANKAAGEHRYSVSFAELPPGMYMIRVTAGESAVVRKFLRL